MTDYDTAELERIARELGYESFDDAPEQVQRNIRAGDIVNVAPDATGLFEAVYE